MNSELYIAASGLLVEERRLELMANNLANVSTAGFRAQRAFTSVWQTFGTDVGSLVSASNQAVALGGSYEVPGPGPRTPTGRPLDIALGRDDLLAVQSESGRRYTRDGALMVSPEGELTDGAGRPVLDVEGRPIDGLVADASISEAGRVSDGANELGRLLVVRDPEGLLRPEGGNLYTAGGNDAALEQVDEPKVSPGWLEGSGTNVMGELMLMIEAQRAFEGYQKMILSVNEIDRKAANEIAG